MIDYANKHDRIPRDESNDIKTAIDGVLTLVALAYLLYLFN